MPPKKSTSSKKNKKYQKQIRQDVALRAPVALTSDILRLIIARVSPEPPYNYSRGKLLAHLHSMQRLAGVSRQWRVVAKPLLYRVVVVDIDEVKYKTKARDVSGIKGVRTNIGLYVESGLVRIARDMLITVHGLSQVVDQYSHILQHTGFAKTVWPGIERLRYDISGSKISFNSSMFTNARGVDMATLNRILSMSLPCLREIQALGIRGENYVMGAPVSFLIDECLYRPIPLKALNISPCGFYDQKSPYRHQKSLPLGIERLKIDNFDSANALQLPPVLASSLVELALNPVSVKNLWDPYVADGWQDSSSGRLVFSRLQSLSLGFFDNDFVMASFDPRPENEETGEETSLDDSKRCFMRSAKFGTLVFPVLTSLEIRHFHQGLTEFLSVFAASPISNFVLTVPNETIPFNWDLSSLTGLRSFTIRIMRPNELSDMVAIFYCLWLMFRSVSPQLRELTVELYICRGFNFSLFKAGTFGENLASLTLKCEIEPEQLHVVLGAYPNLKRLHLHWIIACPIAPTSELASRLRAMGVARMQTPICRHLQFLRAEGLKHYKYPTIPTSATIAPTTVATEVALYRGLLLNLVCHLPSLVTFKVSSTAFDGISKCINMLTTAGNGPEHLWQLKLQAIDD